MLNRQIKCKRQTKRKHEKDNEIVSELETKLVKIKIPEGTGKWRWDDFCKIAAIEYYDFNGNKIYELKN